MTRIRERLAREEGFTLIELLVVIVIIGILLAIAVPSYLGFKDRANETRLRQANVRAAVPSAEAYFADNGNYTAMTVADLQDGYDSGLKDRPVPRRSRSPAQRSTPRRTASRRPARARLPRQRPRRRGHRRQPARCASAVSGSNQ